MKNGFVLFLLHVVLKYLVFNASLIYHFVNSTFIRIFLEHFFVSIVPHEFKNLNKKLRYNSNIIQSLAKMKYFIERMQSMNIKCFESIMSHIFVHWNLFLIGEIVRKSLKTCSKNKTQYQQDAIISRHQNSNITQSQCNFVGLLF